MVYINLLPIREIKKRINAIQQLSIYGVVLLAFLIAIGFSWFYQANIVSGLTKDISTLNQEKQRYNQILEQIKKLEQDKKLIENKIAVIRQLKKTSALTVHVLDEIANLTPTKRVWLKSLVQSGTSLSLSGMALDNQTLANYMEELKKSPYIMEVNLLASSQSSYAGRNLKSFTLACVISIPETGNPAPQQGTTKQ